MEFSVNFSNQIIRIEIGKYFTINYFWPHYNIDSVSLLKALIPFLFFLTVLFKNNLFIEISYILADLKLICLMYNLRDGTQNGL